MTKVPDPSANRPQTATSLIANLLTADGVWEHLRPMPGALQSPDEPAGELSLVVADGRIDVAVLNVTSRDASFWQEANLATVMKKAKALQFSPNGLELIAAFDAGPQLAWSTVTGRPIAPGSTSTSWVLERSFGTGDGKSLITDRANSIAFSPDGKTALSGSYDMTLILWDVASGEVERTLEGHGDWVTACALSGDGRRLVSIELRNRADGVVQQSARGCAAVCTAQPIALHIASVLGDTWQILA